MTSCWRSSRNSANDVSAVLQCGWKFKTQHLKEWKLLGELDLVRAMFTVEGLLDWGIYVVDGIALPELKDPQRSP